MTIYAAQSGSVSAANSFIPSVSAPYAAQNYCIRVQGTFVGTISIQTKYVDESAWFTEYTSQSPFSQIIEVPPNMQVQVGFETGNYTSGTAEIDIAAL